MTPLPAIDISQKELFFKKEGVINNLLQPKAKNDSVHGFCFFDVAEKVSTLTELGSTPVLFLDEDKKIRLSVGHWSPDDSQLMYVATLNQGELLEFSLIDKTTKRSAPFFLEGVNFDKLFKSRDCKKYADRVGITSKSRDDTPSIQGTSAVVLPPSILHLFMDSEDPIDPLTFLNKVCNILREKGVTVTDKQNLRKVISVHAKELVIFAVSAYIAKKEGISLGQSFLDTDDIEEITFQKVENFLEAVRDDIVLDDDYYDRDEDDNDQNSLAQSSDAGSPIGRPSVSPSFARQQDENSDKVGPAMIQLTNVVKSFVTSVQDGLVNKSSPKKKTFFEKDQHEDFKEQMLMVQSLDGKAPAVEIDQVTQKFYKFSASAQAANLSRGALVKFSVSVCQSLQFSIHTSKNFEEIPSGFSIFGLSIQKAGDLDVALMSQGISESVMKASFTQDELKSLLVSNIVPPKNVFHMMEIVKAFKLFLEKFAGPSSYLVTRYSAFVQDLETLQQEMYRLFESDGTDFIVSFLQAINARVSTFVNLCEQNILSELSFAEIVSNIRESRFMNSFRVSAPNLVKSSSAEVPKYEKKRSLSYSNGANKKRKPSVEVTSPYEDLLWNDWKRRGNGSVRKQNKIDLPVIRNRTVCPRFYFQGSCNFSDCIDEKGHFKNLSSSEKAQILDLKKKCIQCTSNQANMKAIDKLYKLHGMTGKYDSSSEAKEIEDESEEDEMEIENPEQMESSEKSNDPDPMEVDGINSDPDPEEEVINMIKKILATPSPTFAKSPFIFKNTKKARVHNSRIIEKFDHDFKKTMDNHDVSVIHPGSEFRDSSILEPLLKNHPDWNILKEILDLGVDLGLDPEKIRDEETRLKDFDEALKKGNSGTMSDPLAKETVAKNQEKEIKYGRTIPITIDCARKLKNGSLTPLGCAVQWTINEKNEKVIKRRTTHNLSFEWLSGLSVNSSVDPNCLEDIIYGHCLLRCIHIMHQMRLRYPKVSILMSKFDIDSAFRRLHSWCEHAPLYLSVLPAKDDVDGLTAFLDMRMPFGSNQGPGKFGIVSETATDLANYLMRNKKWDPKKLKSSFSDKIPDKELLDEMVEFGQAFPLLANIEDFKSYWDVFVDDLINLTLANMGLEEKAREAAAIALEILFRPKVENEEVERNYILKWEKLLAEG